MGLFLSMLVTQTSAEWLPLSRNSHARKSIAPAAPAARLPLAGAARVGRRLQGHSGFAMNVPIDEQRATAEGLLAREHQCGRSNV